LAWRSPINRQLISAFFRSSRRPAREERFLGGEAGTALEIKKNIQFYPALYYDNSITR
jgi:hypothetical protein